MRKKGAALWLVILLVAASGCGNKEEQLVESGEMIVTPQNNGSTEDGERNEKEEEDRENKEESNNVGENQAEDSLEGMVREINEKDNFVIVSKIFTEEIGGGTEAAVTVVGEGAEGEELINVYFTENTGFKIKTVKNAGEEVTEKEGAFSDIKVESTLELKGKMDAKGEEFLADEVIIYEFIYS